MKSVNEIWKELFKDQLDVDDMLRVRGGDGTDDENPDDPIVK
jgi:hypothetical protein